MYHQIKLTVDNCGTISFDTRSLLHIESPMEFLTLKEIS
jgi:hypothetical protein